MQPGLLDLQAELPELPDPLAVLAQQVQTELQAQQEPQESMVLREQPGLLRQAPSQPAA